MLQISPTPPILQFNHILASLVKINHYPTAISLFRQLEFNGIKPSIVTLTILMNCYCHTGGITFLFSILTKILKMGYEPNSITFTTLIKGMCLNGQAYEALLFHDHVVAHGFKLDQVSYAILMNGLCKMGETRAAMQMLRKIWVNTDLVMYRTIIDSLCKDKLVNDDYELYPAMIAKEIFPNIF